MAIGSCWCRPRWWVSFWWSGDYATGGSWNWRGSNPLGFYSREGPRSGLGTSLAQASEGRRIGDPYASELPEIWSAVPGEALKGSVLLAPTLFKICTGRFEGGMASLPLCDGKSGDGTTSSLVRARCSCCLGVLSVQCFQCGSLEWNWRRLVLMWCWLRGVWCMDSFVLLRCSLNSFPFGVKRTLTRASTLAWI